MSRKVKKNCRINDEVKKYKNDDLTGNNEIRYLKNREYNDLTDRRELENYEAIAGSASECSSHSLDYDETELLEQLSVLQVLRKKERELKINILHEQYMKEDLVTTDETLFSEKIAEFQDIVQEKKANFKLTNTMCLKEQLTQILQKIMLSFSEKNKNYEEKNKSYKNKEDEMKRLILGLVVKKKEIEKEISLQQLEIAAIEEKCLKMDTSIDNSIHEKVTYSNTNEIETKNEEKKQITRSTVSKENEKLKRLKAENKKRNDRIQLLSRTLLILITNLESDSLNNDLKILASSCENILSWDYENIDEIEELCKSVYSTTV